MQSTSSLSHSVVFLYFFALIAEKGLLVSPCYSLELCIRMLISFLLSFDFLVEILVFLILLFSSFSLHCSLRKSSYSLLAILWNSAFGWVYLSFSSLPLASVLFSAICKATSDNHFVLLHFFFLGIVW